MTTEPAGAGAVPSGRPRFLLSSHDGFGLGHTRRNSRIARALLRAHPRAEVVLVTALSTLPPWLAHPGLRVVDVPSLVKGPDGRYAHPTLPVREVLARRARTFADLVRDWRPDAVLVDRHPFGTYRLPVAPHCCGWVCEPVPSGEPDSHHLVVAAGGGADGRLVLGLGRTLLEHRPEWHATVLAGPLGEASDDAGGGRIRHVRNASDTPAHLVRAGGVIQMAGYNSTVEALAAGLRPILVPRRTPRREQAIRALRLASLGLADVVDDDSAPSEVAWLLDRPRRLEAGRLEAAGIRLDGAERAAERIGVLLGDRLPRGRVVTS